jgi:O-glycosyl hydrolase
MKWILLVTAVLTLNLAEQAPAQSQCNVNWNDVRQRIDGFGASSAWRNSWTAAQGDMFFSTNTGIGLSLLRNHITYANTTSPTATPSTGETSIMGMALARGALVWSAPWTPAAGFKSSNMADGGNYLGNGANATNMAYASQLANYVVGMKNLFGSNVIYALSVQNEPNFNTTGYESCVWNGQQIHDFVTNLYNALVAKGVGSTKIIIPESQNWSADTGLFTPSMNDANVAPYVSVIADHNYDGCPPSGTPAALSSYGKSLWETEVAKLSCAGAFDGSMADGIYWAGRIHLFLASAQANAWHYWWLISANADNEGLTDTSGNPAKRMYVLGQWSRFVRPGYYRIGVNGNAPSVLITAFKDPNSAMFAVVAVNTNSYDTNAIFYLQSFSAATVTPWITSSSLSLASQSAVAVTSGSFTYTLPAMSVVTFVGQGQTNLAPTGIALSNSSVPENQPAGTAVGTFSTTDPNSGDTFTYTLVSGTGSDDNASFAISGNTLQTAAIFNYQTQNSYSIRVRTTDPYGLWFEEVFTISVIAVPTDISLSNSSVLEAQPAGTTVGTFSTTDPNGSDTFTYTLVAGAGSTDNGSFAISGNTLQTAAVFAYDVQNTYSIRVRSTTQNNQWVEEPFTITVIDVNVPPNTPTNVSPSDGAVNQSLTPTLQASAFSDPNAGDSQTASEWLIQRNSDNALILDSGTDSIDTTNFTVSAGLLDYVTAYTWQVRYQDNHGAWSGYSAATAFSTLAPTLSVTKQAGNVVISWPTNATGFALEYSTDLTTTNWNPVSPDPMILGSLNVVTNGMTNPATFFRLYKP